jgi:hypothetical protein
MGRMDRHMRAMNEFLVAEIRPTWNRYEAELPVA